MQLTAWAIYIAQVLYIRQPWINDSSQGVRSNNNKERKALKIEFLSIYFFTEHNITLD